MKRCNRLTAFLAALLAGGTLLSNGCKPYQELVWPSIRDGLYSYASGSIGSSYISAAFGDYVVNSLLGNLFDNNNSLFDR
ncbi:MAG: hypothetical protein GXY44_00935 [Phycisphaerales bacterium]|nr:hypothetical protein [Phycisphaerales bacterium]